MSWYVATFGTEPDVGGLRHVRLLHGVDIPPKARNTMMNLAKTYRLGEGVFVVDETGDTAGVMLEEALDGDQRSFANSRLDTLLTRAEGQHAALAIWDATWDERRSGMALLFTNYSDLRAFLARCEDVWDIAGVLCNPMSTGGETGTGV